MTLRELDAEFLKREDGGYRMVATLQEADGITYVCPQCFVNKGNAVVGAHHIIDWFRGKVPDDASPGPGRWTPSGTGIDDLTFVPGDPPMMTSVRLQGECNAHYHVKNGAIEFCDDSGK